MLRLFIVIKNPAVGERIRNSVFYSSESSSFQFIMRDSLLKGIPIFRNNTPDYVLLDWPSFSEIWDLYEKDLESCSTRELGLVEKAAAYIDDHLGEHIEAEDVAAHCFVTRRHLGAIFRDRMGMSILSYTEMKRMEKAKKLLARPGMQIKEILHRCGFRSAAYFSNQFRKNFGVTPTEYRKKILKEPANEDPKEDGPISGPGRF